MKTTTRDRMLERERERGYKDGLKLGPPYRHYDPPDYEVDADLYYAYRRGFNHGRHILNNEMEG